ncbi:MAG: Na+ dependent nucleoside transporter N-terminal domain-containing protein [Elusimicrobiota bacterium]
MGPIQRGRTGGSISAAGRPSLLRAGRVWAFFAMCGLFGALGTAAFSVGAAKDSPASSSAPAANPIQAEMAVRRAAEAPTSLLERSLSFFGLFALLGLCWLMSTDRRKIDWRLVAWGMALQLLFGVIVLKTAPGLWFFSKLNDGALALLGFTQEGVKFLFSSFLTGQIE